MQPESLTTVELRALPDAARIAFDRARRVWHANLGSLRTPQLEAQHEDLWDILDSNPQDGDKAKGAAAVDVFPGWARARRCWRWAGRSTGGRLRRRASTRRPGTSGGRYPGSD
ncbi:hypothetical protein ACIRL2_40270 [Embleya sp. NPDC127516]|uniref:hypothetical protein n=1 Tax=Embleya sp. NPDC127516 TaxID=3363990 RepID=UPI00382CC2F1